MTWGEFKERLSHFVPSSQDKRQVVYLVVYGNYFPVEAESVWSPREMAQHRADHLSGDWRVAKFAVDNPNDSLAESL